MEVEFLKTRWMRRGRGRSRGRLLLRRGRFGLGDVRGWWGATGGT